MTNGTATEQDRPPGIKMTMRVYRVNREGSITEDRGTVNIPHGWEPYGPVDIKVMRETARILLEPDAAPDALPPGPDELDTLTRTLSGHLELLVPEVEKAAGRLHKESIPRYCALACVGEARGKLRSTPRPGVSRDVAHARKLARVLNALCEHYEKLAAYAHDRGAARTRTSSNPHEFAIEGDTMKTDVIATAVGGGGGGEGGDGLPGEPWPGPEEPPSPDGGPRAAG
ncbi:DUF6415 family natural product biosynthesis protein [Streptomyces sp. NPDC086549]|uniref:DUF6415 family natural product biosynthesis protein n=1 Tax=Streptomyces sp. NPDC086549 TaxID=3365752 RepID=UPI0037F7DEFE